MARSLMRMGLATLLVAIHVLCLPSVSYCGKPTQYISPLPMLVSGVHNYLSKHLRAMLISNELRLGTNCCRGTYLSLSLPLVLGIPSKSALRVEE
jgi:hypothetical protein